MKGTLGDQERIKTLTQPDNTSDHTFSLTQLHLTRNKWQLGNVVVGEKGKRRRRKKGRSGIGNKEK